MTPWIEPDDEYADAMDRAARAAQEFGAVSPARRTDPETSHAAARSIEVTAKNMRGKLLAAYGTAIAEYRYNGLTDEQAQQISGLSPLSGFWKRCSELRNGGYIERTGATRKGSRGMEQMVCRITEKGTAALNKIRSEEF